MNEDSPLPYHDTKPVGAADFYFAINATFRFIREKFGDEGLRRYWAEIGRGYYGPVSKRWSIGGLPAVAEYWKAFFAAEPGAEVFVEQTTESVLLNVKACPAIKHLREHNREIVSNFCQHCYFVSDAIAAPAGFAVRVEGGNGTCRQNFLRRHENLPEQDLSRIKEAA